MAKFITNEQKFLSEVISNVLPSSDRISFLIGYFYFSGFQELYKKLEDKNIRILIGLEVDKDLNNKIIQYSFISENNPSRGKSRESFNKSLVKLFNDTDFFDSKEKQESFKLFLNKIENGTLEIRKTSVSNHSKLYIFENSQDFSQGGEFPGTVITGSSNLTLSGLKNQHEINVVFREPDVFSESKVLFEKLWGESIELVNSDNFENFLNNVIEKTWYEKLPKPYLLYIRVLHEYLSRDREENVKLPSDITSGQYLNLKYQTDAIKEGISALNKHDGIIVADVVGLGKSIIASTIAHNLAMKTIVISPRHLTDQWNDYRFDFGFNAKVYSNGKIEQALEENLDDEDKLIIIDEAHKYRNEMTQDYVNLHKLCLGNKVILLSATPFNNKPQDIFSMVKLFQIPQKSTIQTIDNLSIRFKELVKEYKDISKSQKEGSEDEEAIKLRIRDLAEKIRDIIFPLVIRRSRLDLEAIDEYREDLERQNIEFPEVNPPKLLEYDLGELSEKYTWTLEQIAPDDDESGFIGARYKPVAYLKDFEKYKQRFDREFGDYNLFKKSQRNIAKFMKVLLVRRFESSIYSFEKTLDSLIESSNEIRRWYLEIGKVPIYKKGNLPSLETLLEEAGEEIEGDLEDITFDNQLKDHYERGLEFIDAKELKKGFITDVESDINLLKSIKESWKSRNKSFDPKVKKLKEILKNNLDDNPEKKIIIFTEYSDTAEYVFDLIKNDFRVFKYTSKDSNKSNKNKIKSNFDAGLPKEYQENDYDILIATDAISEGYNLHRAGIIFNYDIPYNPTRVIQRVGRINRVSKKVFDELFIYNFFPTATGESETRTKQISTLKIAMIHALLGEDTRVLTSDEELESFFQKRFEETEDITREKSWDVEYINTLNKIKVTQHEVFVEALKLPKRVRIKRELKRNKNGVLIFGKKGEEYIFKFSNYENEVINIKPSEAINLFKADIEEGAKKVSNRFYSTYLNLKNNLFSATSEISYEKGRVETLQKLDYLIESQEKNRDYLIDLKFTVEELDALPEQYSKMIRAVHEENIDSQISSLILEVPHSYLIEIRNKAEKIANREESLILSEELE